MIQFLIRLFGFLQRLLTSLENIGLISSIKLFFIYRYYSRNHASLFIKKLQKKIYFRGAADKGVMSHFYKEGYRICDNAEQKVKFIIDAGANIGDETLRFRYFHPDAIIIALEPELNNFQLLKKNVTDDAKIIPINKGLWSRECRLKIIPGQSNESFKVVEAEEEKQTCDGLAITVEKIMKDFQTSEIDILKMDIEGSEYEIFSRNFDNWISRVKVYIFECPDSDRSGATFKIFEALLKQKLNYNCSVHGENIILIRDDVSWTLKPDLFFQK